MNAQPQQTEPMQVIVRKPSEAELEKLGVKAWPIWTCENSIFDYEYDEKETCYILAGEVTVVAPNQRVSFGPGDLVIFPKGLKCKWNVTKPVKKHYKFGE